jgi:hypothetical protein
MGKDAEMPAIHYGKIIEHTLEELWETAACVFYRKRFEERVKAHEEKIVEHLAQGFASGRERTLQAARDAMPEAPEGCKVCHYLYDV